MQISIKNEDTCLLARELAEVTGLSLTETIKSALSEMKDALREKRRQEKKSDIQQINVLLEEFDQYAVLDDRHPDEILYDKDGLLK